MKPACMTPDELRLYGRGKPCLDCPMWFAVEMRSKGCCNGQPGRLVNDGSSAPPGSMMIYRPGPRFYATDQERREARRRSWRDYKRRVKARA